jgi:hypothetical protein
LYLTNGDQAYRQPNARWGVFLLKNRQLQGITSGGE